MPAPLTTAVLIFAAILAAVGIDSNNANIEATAVILGAIAVLNQAALVFVAPPRPPEEL